MASRPSAAKRSGRIRVLVLDGDGGLGLPVIRCLGADDQLEVFVAAGAKSNVAVKHSRYVSEWARVRDDDGTERWIEDIEALAVRWDCDVLLATDLPTTALVVDNRDRLAMFIAVAPVPSPQNFAAVNDKGVFARGIAEFGVPHPWTAAVSGGGHPDFVGLEFPAFVKPADGAGGLGISVVHDVSELQSDLAGRDQGQAVVVQSGIPGYDIDCSVVCLDGEVLEMTVQQGFVTEERQFGPSKAIEVCSNRQIESVVRGLMGELGWSGPAHIDLRMDETTDSPVVIEVNARFWASILGSLRVGVNFPSVAVQAAVGRLGTPTVYKPGRYIAVGGIVALAKQRRWGELRAQDLSVWGLLRDPKPELFLALVNARTLRQSGTLRRS